MRAEWGIVLVVPFLMLVHGLPHVPGEPTSGPVDAYVELGSRAGDAARGDDYPYPLHVDEHIHLAWMHQIVREKTADISDPYTGAESSLDLFTVSGMRSERGWNVAIVQLHLLTDVPLEALARFLPALWAGFLGAATWMLLRPAPGAVAGAAFLAVMTSTPRFLGIGFLVPSSFAVPWVVVTLLVAIRCHGPKRFFGLLLLITGAHFMHLVLGVLSIAAALAGTAVRSEKRSQRLWMALAALLPLLWILPTTLADAQDAVTREHTLPFTQQLFAAPGILLYVAAALGAALAFWKPSDANRPHRAMALMLVPMVISMSWSILTEHHNEATYARQVFVFFLCVAALAGYGIVGGLKRLQERLPRPAAWRPAHVAASVATVALVLAPGLAAVEATDMYRIHNEGSWEAGQRLEEVARPGDVFLSHPWQAPLYTALSGAQPHTYLKPGSPPINGDDWGFYQRSEGADPEWLRERGIDLVVATTPPNAPHTDLGQGIYRIT